MGVFNGTIDIGLSWVLECVLRVHVSVTFIFLDVTARDAEVWVFVAKCKPYSVCTPRMATVSQSGLILAMSFQMIFNQAFGCN